MGIVESPKTLRYGIFHLVGKLMNIDIKNLNPQYLIHLDISRTRGLVREKIKKYRAGSYSININKINYEFLSSILGEDNLIFTAFNYDFLKQKFLMEKNEFIFKKSYKIIRNYF